MPPLSEPGSPRPLTPRQACCLQIIAEFIDLYGYAPSCTELAHELDMVSKGAASILVGHLESKGWLRRTPGRVRAIEVLHRPTMPDFSPIEFVLSDRAFLTYAPLCT